MRTKLTVINKKLLVLIPLGMLCSCSPGDKQQSTDNNTETVEMPSGNVMTQQQLLDSIAALEPKIFTNDFYVQKEAAAEVQKLDKYYEKYIAAFRYDRTNTPQFMLKRAAFKREAGAPLEAVKIYVEVQKLFPDFEKNAESAFLVAFIYDNDLNNKELAKEEYQNVVEKYKGSYWAYQAKERLQNIDLSDEELIEKFRQNNPA